MVVKKDQEENPTEENLTKENPTKENPIQENPTEEEDKSAPTFKQKIYNLENNFR